jgi:hypothetical protein
MTSTNEQLAEIKTIYDNWLAGALSSEDTIFGIAEVLQARDLGVDPKRIALGRSESWGGLKLP